MNTQITLRKDLIEKLKLEKGTKSYSMLIDDLFQLRDNILAMETAVVPSEGRISKTLAGKTIKYFVVPDESVKPEGCQI